MSRTPIESSVVYHIYNRGVEKRDVFMDNGDRSRFVHYLYQFNDNNPSDHLTFFFNKSNTEEVEPPKLVTQRHARKQIVDILAFALMPNHYHLMIRQKVPGGISAFMHRIGTGYTMFFNEKYERSGGLFQGRFKYKPVITHAQLLRLPHYIHLNPLDLFDKKKYSLDPLEKLLQYKWSSLQNYTESPNFPSVTAATEMVDLFGGTEKYMEDLANVLQERQILFSELTDVALDHQ